MKEHFFYHSFPRGKEKDSQQSIDEGIAILESIRDSGLLLVPQVINWNRPNRYFQIVQNRVCFTHLRPEEVMEHGKRFGYFALEFEADSLRSLGGTPAFYVPVGQTLYSDAGPINILEESRIHTGINGKSILDLTRRVIVPAKAVDQVKKIIKHPIPIIAIETL